MRRKKISMHFRVDTPALLKEIVDNAIGATPNMGILKFPMNTFRNLLCEIAQRASEINDPVLNRIMFDMALYELPKPTSKEYGDLMDKIYSAEEEYLRNKTHAL